MIEITAAVTRSKGGEASLERLRLDSPRPDEVTVRVVGVGICHADLFMRDQVYPVETPVVLGHEAAGIVEQTGTAVTVVEVGDRVVVSYNSCGICETCAEGSPQYCLDFYRRNFACEREDGSSPFVAEGETVRGYFFGQSSFATHVLAPERAVVKVPAGIRLELAAPLACGVQTGAGAVLKALDVPAGASFAVYGAGSVGLSAVMAARHRGAAPIVAVDRNPARLEAALELGATHVVDAREGSVVEEVKEATGGAGARFALDTTGSPEVIRQAIDALGVRGVCGTVGANRPETEIALNLIDMMASGRTFRGIVEGDVDPHTFIPELIALQQGGSLPFDRIIETYPFARINDAIADVEAGKTIKAVLVMDP